MANTKSASQPVIRNLTEGPLARQLFLFTMPLVGANLLQAMYTLVDLWVVGNFCTTATISAVSVSGQIVYLMHAVGMGIGNGGQIIISQQVGAKDYDNLKHTIGTMLSFCILSSIVIAIVGAVGRSLWLSLMQTPAEAVPEAVTYLMICCLGVPFVYVGGTFGSILRGVGNSKTPMYVLAVSTITNIILDFILVGYFGMGAAGAAWATVIAQFVSFIYALIVVYRIRDGIGFDFKPASFKIRGRSLRFLLKLSAPLVAMSTCISISSLIVTSLVNTAGLAASAISGIGSKLMSLIGVVSNSISAAVGSMGAQNFAAGKIDRVKRINLLSSLASLACFCVVAVIFWIFPEQIIGIFTTASNTEVLSLAETYLHIAVFGYFGSFMMGAPNGHINAVGFTTLNLVISFLDAFPGRIGLAILFGQVFGMGVTGYWIGAAIAPHITTTIAYGYYLSGRWIKRKPLV